ncbi:MAG TPA: tetratricopeptide repeat protein [Verrucomicrobiae bacterium]|nr:tetratricopeptide repeat protein [Verrucomicrobiae bacterium]
MRFLVLLLLLAAPVFAAEAGEAEAFAAAAKASQDGFHERAEKEWAEFLRQFPKSERANEGALAQAQARYHLKQYPAALEILNARAAQAGPLADQYQFWRGQVELDSTNYGDAEQAFADLLKSQTNSPLRLNASVAQAQSRFRRDDFGGVVELLAATNTAFQIAARDSTNTGQIARGYLMLAEAQLRRNDLAGAGAALQALAAKQLSPELAWERWQLLARLEFAGATPQLALPALTNAATQARAAGKPLLLAQTFNLQADVFRKLNQPTRAAQAYEAIVSAEAMPPEQKRIGLLREVELYASQNAFTNAAARIALYLNQNTNDTSADLLTIKAGEFLLEAFRQHTNSAAATNLLADARSYFDAAIQRYTNSPLIGKAWLDRGWALWEEHLATGNGQQLLDSQAAFQSAAEKLPPGDEQAQARFKIADAQFQQSLFGAAATNYQAVLSLSSNSSSVRSNLVSQAAEQLIRCHLAQTNFASAETALQQASGLFPASENVRASWILVGKSMAGFGQVEEARALLKEFPTKFPDSALRSEAELAHAKTFALEEKWPEAIDLYTRWTTNHATHPSIAQAEFERAWLHFKAGQETNAFQLFTNFVARFPTNSLSAQAQNWIADYFFNREQWNIAELNYQRVFQDTNWNAGDLECQARIMAARTAFFRQNYGDARSYLTNILQAACSPTIVADALFELGDVLIEQRAPANSTNALENFKEALAAFNRITRMGATNRLEPLAWGKIGDCHLQLATQFPESYEQATNAYQKVLDSKRTDVPMAARNQAEVGIGLTLERMAEIRPKDRMELLKAALDRNLNVAYSSKADPHWRKRAAQAAGRIAEALEPNGTTARALYNRFIQELPAMRSTWEAKLAKLRAQNGI